ncbi:MAG: DUF2017 domain-containing protein [Nocardioidaceae bacterium]
MSHFKSRRKGRVHVELPGYAAGLLSNLARQLVELLSDGEAAPQPGGDPLEEMLTIDGPRDAPEDPALKRLLPDAHADDADAAAEFRRFTERGLRLGKVGDAMVVIDTIGPVDEVDAEDVEFELDAEQARSWMRSLTDMRLTMAERLGVTADDEAYWESMPAEDPRLQIHEIFGWLGYLLESLLEAVEG